MLSRDGWAGYGEHLRDRRHILAKWPHAAAGLVLCLAGVAGAQTCTTQAKMPAELRTPLSDRVVELGADVKANASVRIEAETVAEVAQNFAAVAYLVRTTSTKLSGDTLQVTQLYKLDASSKQAGDNSEVDFACSLAGTPNEADFDIPALPKGVYAFAMVEARGDRPWLLSFLLQQQGDAWKLAGFYSHATTAAGHDGLWYWNAAREAAKAQQLWRAWVLYGEADQLLTPAPFVDSTHLDKLRSEQHAATPPELSAGISPQTPMVIPGAAGADYRFTSISSDASDDGTRLNLMLHYTADAQPDANLARARNIAAAKALLTAHKELRQGFDGVWVFADTAGQPPFGTEHKMTEIP